MDAEDDRAVIQLYGKHGKQAFEVKDRETMHCQVQIFPGYVFILNKSALVW